MTVTIYYKAACGTSRNALAMIRASGEDPEIIEYLDHPLSLAELRALIARLGIAPSELLRAKEAKAAELGLTRAAISDDALLAAMQAHPILINRPVVITDTGAALCRPSERVLALLANPVAVFEKEDGEIVHARHGG
ncbi:arsenate reductase (glutaredoxin) [Salinisphaera japonica]|uniref:Arsenate reductase n=1 Tax=Salinisphaera japonica YTM-1 TaxID=1209778 RepID=A0A423PYH6_9GAMM|nr:arsenate reductase (glutaredoxin) [Salinisphaera japonica]ROO30665.1 arsenate reductase [Salinisphaera japonica YTM-1]